MTAMITADTTTAAVAKAAAFQRRFAGAISIVPTGVTPPLGVANASN